MPIKRFESTALCGGTVSKRKAMVPKHKATVPKNPATVPKHKVVIPNPADVYNRIIYEKQAQLARDIVSSTTDVLVHENALQAAKESNAKSKTKGTSTQQKKCTIWISCEESFKYNTENPICRCTDCGKIKWSRMRHVEDDTNGYTFPCNVCAKPLGWRFFCTECNRTAHNKAAK